MERAQSEVMQEVPGMTKSRWRKAMPLSSSLTYKHRAVEFGMLTKILKGTTALEKQPLEDIYIKMICRIVSAEWKVPMRCVAGA